ncbi:hypothetical protein [Streptomyces sp. 058-1L]|uniref:hypothetical protein n=1 Tax=Streptomyces sp. 058-1L TaxID=2789266 RepID=UPI0039811381
MTRPSTSRAQSASSARRAGARTTPVGNWRGRGHDHGPGGSGLMQEVDAQAVLVPGYRDGGQPCGGHGEVELRPAGVLERHVGVPGGP